LLIIEAYVTANTSVCELILDLFSIYRNRWGCQTRRCKWLS